MNPLEETTVSCPYCGENIRLLVDTTGLPDEYIEDCEVCCRPIRIVAETDGELLSVSCRQEDDCY